MKGKISVEKTVWCGLCAHWDQRDNYNFIREIRKIGWKQTKEHGWLCPECIKKYTKQI